MKQYLFILLALVFAIPLQAKDCIVRIYSNSCSTPQTIFAPAGDELLITAIPQNDDYQFVSWTDGNTDNPRTVTITDNTAYTANFVPVGKRTGNTGKDCIVRVYSNGCQTPQTILAPVGDSLIITATPLNDEYHFVQWSDGNMDNPRSVKVENNIAYTAIFEHDGYLLSLFVSDCETPTVVRVNPDQQVEVTAVPLENGTFVDWNDGETDNPRVIVVTDNMSVTANMQQENVGPTTDIPSSTDCNTATKLLRDGQILIQRGAHTFTLQGQVVE